MGKFYEGLYGVLELYVRQAAWLAATPEGSKESRAESFKTLDVEPEMPAVDAEHLIDHLWHIGPAIQGSPVSHQEIRAYQKNMGFQLNPWECGALRRLSVAYLVELRKAEKKNAPAPFDDKRLRGLLTAKALQDHMKGLSKL